MELVYKVKDKPPVGKLIVAALQQLLAILAATIAVPAVIGNGMSASAALFGAGAGTLVYLLFTRFRSPVFLGSSFAFLGSMATAFAGGVSMSLGYLGLIVGAVFAGLVYVVIAIAVKFAGVGWVDKLMPPVVVGPTVAIIGLSLSGNAIGDIMKGNVTRTVTDWQFVLDDLGNKVMQNGVPLIEEVEQSVMVCSPYLALICGLVTLAVTIICSVYGKKTLKLFPFIIGIVAGYALAAILTGIGMAADVDAMKIIDFSAFRDMQWLPEFTFLTAFSGDYGANVGAYIGTIAVAYVPVAFVVFAEHIADHKNLSSIIGTDLLRDPGLSRTLLGDGVGSMVGAFFGGCPNTTYGESVGCVAITGNASVWTILATSILAIVISFFGPFVTFLASIPSCVMGGVCVALYGFIAVSGLKMIQKVDLNENRNLFVVSVILIAGVGGMTLNFGQVTITSVACALILGILVNVLCSVRKTEGTDAGDADGEAAESGESKSETETTETSEAPEAPAEEAAVSDAGNGGEAE